MLPRKQNKTKPNTVRNGASFRLSDLRPEVREARQHMARQGWSYRAAAKKLNVHHMHLTHVLTGRRVSLSLCVRLQNLPARKEAA